MMQTPIQIPARDGCHKVILRPGRHRDTFEVVFEME